MNPKTHTYTYTHHTHIHNDSQQRLGGRDELLVGAAAARARVVPREGADSFVRRGGVIRERERSRS